MTMGRGSCQICHWWKPVDEKRTIGQCRRNPPQVAPWATDNQHPIVYVSVSHWPETQADEWCGEFGMPADFRK